MYCKNCGKEIPDNSVYCTYCGTLVGESVIKGDVKPEEKITFKDAIKALFTRLFVFEGKTGQREFNFGFLFLIIISSALSMIMTMPEANRITQEIMSSNTFDEAILEEYINSLISRDIFHFSNLYNIGVAILYSVFLVAPVFRRMVDTGKSKQIAMLCAILFVVSELVCSNILFCLLPENIYSNIVFIIDIFSIVNLVVILMCVFGKTSPEVK